MNFLPNRGLTGDPLFPRAGDQPSRPALLRRVIFCVVFFLFLVTLSSHYGPIVKGAGTEILSLCGSEKSASDRLETFFCFSYLVTDCDPFCSVT